MTGYLLSFPSIFFSLISSFVIDWIVLIEWQLRHSSVTHNKYIIVPPDGQMAPCVVGVFEGTRPFHANTIVITNKIT